MTTYDDRVAAGDAYGDGRGRARVNTHCLRPHLRLDLGRRGRLGAVTRHSSVWFITPRRFGPPLGSVVFWVGIALFVIGALAMLFGVIMFGASFGEAISGGSEDVWKPMQEGGLLMMPLGFVMLIAGIAMIVIGRRRE